MSYDTRESKRRANKRKKIVVGIVLFLVITSFSIGTYRKNKTLIIEKTEYTNIFETNFFMFKDIGYVFLDDFSSKDLTLKEGEKTNGYKQLTHNPMPISKSYLNEQIGTINQTIEQQYYNNWPSVINEIKANYVGVNKVTTQFGQEERDRKKFIVNSVQFMGDDLETLNEKKSMYESFDTGKPATITLSDLHMPSTGYVFSTLNTMEKVVSQNALPFINTEFLENASKIEKQDENALKVVNNDHIFSSFVLKKDMKISNEETVFKMKDKLMRREGILSSSEYYRFLVKRVDLLREFPKIAFSYKGDDYSGYFVDTIEDGDNKIIVLLLKDYINVFSKEIFMKTPIYLERYPSYQIPKESIINKDHKTYVLVLEKGFYKTLVEVKVKKYDKGKAVLDLEEEKNQNLSPGTIIKAYP